MPTSYNLRNGLYLPSFEDMATPLFVAGNSGSNFCGTHYSDPYQPILGLYSTTGAALYNTLADSWSVLTSPAWPAFGVGNALCWNPNGPTGTVSAASSNSITTNYTALRNLVGYSIRILSGAGAGQERVIATNTVSANSKIVVTVPWGVQPDATSTWVIRSGRFYALVAGTLAAGYFRYFDFASFTWTNLSVTGLPATWGTNGRMVAPCCTVFSTGAVTAASSNTISASAKNYGVNKWTNHQVRILSGKGAGQIRTIASNTTQQLTVTVAWTDQPDSSSTFEIGGNEDYIYLSGSASTTLYLYSISGNVWTTLSPLVVRGLAFSTGSMLNLVDQETDPSWTDERNYINGSRIYSFHGGGTAGLFYYDLVANTWWNDSAYSNNNAFSYAGRGAAFNIGTSTIQAGGKIYLDLNGTGVWYRFSPVKNLLEACGIRIRSAGGLIDGTRAATFSKAADGTGAVFVYTQPTGSSSLYRFQVIP